MEHEQPTPAQSPTDRDILVALLNLVAATAERLTGERPTLTVYFNGDQFVSITPTTSAITWAKPAAESPQRDALGE